MIDSYQVKLCLKFSSNSKIAAVLARAEVRTEGCKIVIKGETVEDAQYLARYSVHIALRIYSLDPEIEVLDIGFNTSFCEQSVFMTCLAEMEFRLDKILNRV